MDAASFGQNPQRRDLVCQVLSNSDLVSEGYQRYLLNNGVVSNGVSAVSDEAYDCHSPCSGCLEREQRWGLTRLNPSSLLPLFPLVRLKAASARTGDDHLLWIGCR